MEGWVERVGGWPRMGQKVVQNDENGGHKKPLKFLKNGDKK